MILIVGTGAVGTILATYLVAAGRDVGLYARPKDLARFGPVEHLRVDFPDRRPPLLAARPHLLESLDLDQVDQLLIGVKYPDLDALLTRLPDPIPAHCTLVSTLNGVAPLRALRHARPGARIVPMSVMMNGQLQAPLHARLTTRAEIVLGSDDPVLLGVFRGVGMTVEAAQGDEAVWGKLLINLANAICAATHTTFKDLFCDPDLRSIYVATLDEATAALAATRTPWKLPLIVPYPVYRSLLLHGGPLPWWFAKYRNGVREGAYPSMVADVQAHRRTEVVQLNGEVLRLSHTAGLPSPINARLVELIEAGPGKTPLMPRELRALLGLSGS
ncbi:ketopantoate reductase family protein [Panacagrimonas sp.]|uniref:ketopantoate reductase family protein n=1 Tax=Panacagrimonas sp. TaxID=2480088 RepID=UPI003B51A94C